MADQGKKLGARKRLEALRAALIEGEQSGPAEPFDVDAFIDEMRGDQILRDAGTR